MLDTHKEEKGVGVRVTHEVAVDAVATLLEPLLLAGAQLELALLEVVLVVVLHLQLGARDLRFTQTDYAHILFPSDRSYSRVNPVV